MIPGKPPIPVRLENPNTLLEIDSSVPDMKRLAKYSHDLSEIVKDLRLPKDSQAAGTFDDLLGAVYALILARHHEFVDRPPSAEKVIEFDKVQVRALEIKDGKVRLDGKWMAGWHFNSALYRIASTFHRLSRVVTNTPDSEDIKVFQLKKAVQKLYGENSGGKRWRFSNVSAVHDQVNHLKHEAKGNVDERSVTYKEALDALGDLIELAKAWKRSLQRGSAVARARIEPTPARTPSRP